MSIYCPNNLGDHEELACYDIVKGGIGAVGILFSGHGITDFTDETQYQDAIDNGKLKIIGGIRGQMPEGSPVEVPNPKEYGPANIIAGYDRTFTWTDGAVTADNSTFYNELNDAQAELLMYNHNAEAVWHSGTTCSFNARLNIPDNRNAASVWNVEARWSRKDSPEQYDASTLASIFGAE